MENNHHDSGNENQIFGATMGIIKSGVLNAFPSDVRYKVKQPVIDAIECTAYMTSYLLSHLHEEYVTVGSREYNISDYQVPLYVLKLMAASRVYANEDAIRRGKPIFEAKGIVGLFTANAKVNEDKVKLLTPHEYNEYWRAINGTRISVPLHSVEYKPAVLADFQAVYASPVDGNRYALCNATGTIPEAVTRLVGVTVPWSSEYYSMVDALDKEEVRKWISDNFLAAQDANG